MKFTRRKMPLLLGLALLVAGGLWRFGPFSDVQVVASLIDRAKLAQLGERGANPRLNKVVYWLHHAESLGLPPTTTIHWAQWWNGEKEPRAGLVQESLLRNLKIAAQLGLFDSENLDHLRHGRAATIRAGPYRGETVEIDHIVPYSLAPEAGNDLANLEMLPKTLNRQKSNRVGDRQIAHAEKLRAAGLITEQSWDRVRKRSSR